MLSRLTKISEEQIAVTFSQAAVGIAHVAPDGSWLRVNDRLCETLGYSRQDLIGHRFQDVTHPEDLETDLEQMLQVIAGKILTYSIEKRYIRKDQTVIWAHLTVSMVSAEDPSASYFISVVEDISARKKAEEEVAQVQLQLQQLLHERTLEKDNVLREFLSFFMMSSDVMVVFSTDGYAKRFNRATVDLLGYSEEELLAVPWSHFIHPADVPSTFSLEYKLVKGGDTLTGIENRYICKDGSIRYLSWSVAVIPESELRFALARDMTEARKKEKLVAEEKLRLASISKMNSLGRMAANIAHEINNPLTVIYGQACQLGEMCAGDNLDQGKVKKIATDITDMSSRISTIIRGLRLFAREGSRDAKEIKSVEGIVNDTLELCRNQLHMGGVELDTSAIDKELVIDCRTTQISQVILNLINNAYDAVQYQSEKKIWLRTQVVGEFCQILVVDSGAGVDVSAQENLFQPFFTTKPLGKGTGLGLSISLQIVEDHGGRLFYQPYEGQTCFVIELPRIPKTL